MTLFDYLMVFAALMPFLVGTRIGRFCKLPSNLLAFSKSPVRGFVLLVLIISLMLPICMIAAAYKLIQNGAVVGEQAALQSRSIQLYIENNLAQFFSDTISGKNQICRRATLSQSIERAWQEEFHRQSCANSNCASDINDHYERLRQTYNPHNRILVDVSVLARALEPAYATAAALNKRSNEFTASSECQDLHPAKWMAADGPIVDTPPTLCVGACKP